MGVNMRIPLAFNIRNQTVLIRFIFFAISEKTLIKGSVSTSVNDKEMKPS